MARGIVTILTRILSIPDRILRRLALLLIAAYQKILSPLLGNRCRFYPSCSEYAKISFTRFPFPRALWLTTRRLSRCHPMCKGGEDFPPES